MDTKEFFENRIRKEINNVLYTQLEELNSTFEMSQFRIKVLDNLVYKFRNDKNLDSLSDSIDLEIKNINSEIELEILTISKLDVIEKRKSLDFYRELKNEINIIIIKENNNGKN